MVLWCHEIEKPTEKNSQMSTLGRRCYLRRRQQVANDKTVVSTQISSTIPKTWHTLCETLHRKPTEISRIHQFQVVKQITYGLLRIQ